MGPSEYMYPILVPRIGDAAELHLGFTRLLIDSTATRQLSFLIFAI